MECPEEIQRAVGDLLLQAIAILGSGDEVERWCELASTARPAERDYARVFLGDAAERARAWYEPLWEDGGLLIAPKTGQIEARWFVAQAATLHTDPAAQQQFPGGYRDILDRLVPERWWVSWEFVAPGDPYGMQYNGLVWLDGRLGWFPKPWRAFEE